jgi:hypothetical protein
LWSGFLTLFLLLLCGSGWRITTGGGGGTSSGWSGGSATAGADVGQEVLDILALEGLGEEGGPDGLDVGDTGGGDEGLELVGLDGWGQSWGGFLLRRGNGVIVSEGRGVGRRTVGNLWFLEEWDVR